MGAVTKTINPVMLSTPLWEFQYTSKMTKEEEEMYRELSTPLWEFPVDIDTMLGSTYRSAFYSLMGVSDKTLY